ncbi:hypothetical protein TTHERM_00551010 (macronuclear) [Tetrahymena thermophila SB210]|uniref:Uncharacterized protein n=1 Tax=Tetrahymena thermophila (strain SB210) TaxID=312017 RepID=Q22UM7_TETTS|nr:hypothetical protein TTHERM_00551010 [Tetrahymena thermophila SB210]EAR88943.2 hypothetical protein TTHERM_00551010 [Tetrahymena thermophila SB210]|eukprot:XP_001009188.2 hypothetical protein TTHERM_00551010 [Tetrahymena thermophila SB210]
MQRQTKSYFNSTLYDLDFQVPVTHKLQNLSRQGSRSWNKFNPSQQCALSLLEVSRLRSMQTDTDKSFSDYSMSDNNIRTPYSTQKDFLTSEEDSDEEVVMFEVQ